MLVWACVVLRGHNLTDQPRGLFFNQEGQTASKSCITSVTSEQQAIKGFTDSCETDLPAEGFVTHSFCSFLPFGTLGGTAGSVGSTLDWGHYPVPLNCNKLVFFICGWFRVAVQISLSHPEWKHNQENIHGLFTVSYLHLYRAFSTELFVQLKSVHIRCKPAFSQ